MGITAAISHCASASAGEAKARFNVSVRVTHSMGAEAKPTHAAVVDPATRTISVTNALSIRGDIGYGLRFEIIDPAVVSVEVHGLARPLRVEKGTPAAYVPTSTAALASSLTLSYVVTYAEGARAVEHRQPLRVTVQP